jgi:hypothetical protein
MGGVYGRRVCESVCESACERMRVCMHMPTNTLLTSIGSRFLTWYAVVCATLIVFVW